MKLLPMLLLFLATAFAAEPVLEFRAAGKARGTANLSLLRAKLKSRRISIKNPFLQGKEKTYEAFALTDVLTQAFGQDWRSAEFSDVAFIALDGYEDISPLGKLKEDGGSLAFRDRDRESGWEPLGHKKAAPGPFFLIWTSTGQNPDNGYPWPWQIKTISLLRFADQYPAVVPTGAKESSPEWKGFVLFKDRCLKCHAMNSEGGKIGPDLNAPQSITAYRPKPMILEFIRHPSKYRHTQMPDHEDLSPADLEALYQYFKFKSRDSGKTW